MVNDPSFDIFTVRPLAGALGAEIHGLDLRQALAPEVAEDVNKAFLKYHRLCVRAQHLTLDDYRRFARLFGEFSGNPIHVALPDYPEFVRVVKEPGQGGPTFGGSWHSDLPWFEAPPKATMLYAEDAPPYGGDKFYANLHLAYERPSQTLLSMFDSLVRIQSSHNTY